MLVLTQTKRRTRRKSLAYYLGPWQWRDDCWNAPQGCVGALDLRSNPQCGTPVRAEGFGLFAMPGHVALPSEYELFGSNLGQSQPSQCQRRFASMLRCGRSGNDLASMAWDAVTIHSDPTGDDRTKPLVPTIEGDFDLWLANRLIGSKRFRHGDPEALPVQDLLRRAYRAARIDSLEGRTPAVHYRKVLGYWVRKFGLDYRWFQPADVPDEEPVEPTTTITESFDTADSTTLGPDLSWTEGESANVAQVVSNQVAFFGASLHRWARANSDLSSDDHYAQLTVTAGGTGGSVRLAGVITRKDDTTTKSYYAGYLHNSANVMLYKLVAGTATQLGSTTAITFSLPQVLKQTANGSTIDLDWDGVNKISVTDTAVTGNLRCGLGCNLSSSGITVQPAGDNFEAADLGGGGGGGNPYYYYQQAG